MKKLVLILSMLSFTAVAHADVTPRAGSLTLQVNKSADGKSVNFQEVNLSTGAKRDLGAKKFYSLEELREQRPVEGWQMPASIAADVALVIATLVSGGIVLTAIDTIYTSVTAIFIISELAADGAAIYFFDPLNPHTQWQQYLCLREEVITDQNVVLPTDEDVSEFNDALETVLNKLDEGKLKGGFQKLGSR